MFLHFIPITLLLKNILRCFCVFLKVKVSVRVFFDLGELIKLFKKLLVFIHAQVSSEFVIQKIRDNLLQNDLLVQFWFNSGSHFHLGFIPLIKVYLSLKFWVFVRV